MDTEPLDRKWRAFGWHVTTVAGHDIRDVLAALEKAKTMKDKPTVIIARTIKGKGVSFMENKAEFHGKAPRRSRPSRR
jgi:transketolase